jgi:uncharacterized membrane protein YdjX (TVP38/TMEM64 family)
MDKLKRFLPLVIIGALIAALFASGATRYLSLDALAQNQIALRSFVASNFAVALIGFIVIYAIATAASLPGGVFLTLAGGLMFGTWIGGGAVVIGATLGAIAIFYAVKTSLGEAMRAKAEASGGTLKGIMDGVKDGAFGYILTLRLIPAVPFWLINVAAALANAPLRAYALATFFGIMPGTFIYASLGNGIGEILARGDTPDLKIIFQPFVFGPLLALGLLSLGTTLYQRHRAKKGMASLSGNTP